MATLLLGLACTAVHLDHRLRMHSLTNLHGRGYPSKTWVRDLKALNPQLSKGEWWSIVTILLLEAFL